jgi:hypothetical protein
MQAASRVPSMNATAFIMIHGAVTPVKIDHTSSSIRSVCFQPNCYEYTLSTTQLPKNIQLYAPSILGYSYYDEPKTDDFIQKTIKDYNQRNNSSLSVIDFVLKQLPEYEQKHVRALQSKVDNEFALGVQHGSDRTDRLFKSEVITMKQRVKWKKHDCYITEKTYNIDQDNDADPSKKLPSCIIIYCETVRPDIMSVIELYNQPHTPYTSMKGQSVKYNVHYDADSNSFTIDFGDTSADDIQFEDIRDIIKFLLLEVAPHGTTLSAINLSIFDFTCSELEFPEITTSGSKPVLLSSIDTQADPRLVYGTIPEAIFSEMEHQQARLWPSLHKLPDFYQSAMTSPSHSSQYSQSQSATKPSDIHIVHLLDDVGSFADFRLLVESQSQSQSQSRSSSQSRTSQMAFESPPSSIQSSSGSTSSFSSNGGPALVLSPYVNSVSVPRPGEGGGGGGSHRTHTRRRRRRHPRVGKKVSLSNHRRRHTKARSRRSIRKR